MQNIEKLLNTGVSDKLINLMAQHNAHTRRDFFWRCVAISWIVGCIFGAIDFFYFGHIQQLFTYLAN